jgi:hypothetical protein
VEEDYLLGEELDDPMEVVAESCAIFLVVVIGANIL